MTKTPKYRLIVCDLDDTLAETKQPIEETMAQLLWQLTDTYDFCVITGGTYQQIKRNVIERLPHGSSRNLHRFHAMSTSGSVYHRYDDQQEKWSIIYSHLLAVDERENIQEVVERTVRGAGLWEPNPVGERIQDRRSQITFSALGQQASPALKRAWDPTRTKRQALRQQIARALPDYEVVINGNTSIDILQQGVDKGFGVKQLMRRTGYAREEIIFFGDSLQPGGNDYPVLELGVDSVEVDGWQQTERYLRKLLAPPYEVSV